MNTSVKIDAVNAMVFIHTVKRQTWTGISSPTGTFTVYSNESAKIIPTRRSATARHAMKYLFG